MRAAEKIAESGWIRRGWQCNTRSEVILLPHFDNR